MGRRVYLSNLMCLLLYMNVAWDLLRGGKKRSHHHHRHHRGKSVCLALALGIYLLALRGKG